MSANFSLLQIPSLWIEISLGFISINNKINILEESLLIFCDHLSVFASILIFRFPGLESYLKLNRITASYLCEGLVAAALFETVLIGATPFAMQMDMQRPAYPSHQTEVRRCLNLSTCEKAC